MTRLRNDKVNVYLIGFSGCGKSSVGPLLATRLNAKFFDTDDIISRMARKSISQIFAERGEAAFRKLEEKAVRRLINGRHRSKVVALGGGAFENPRIRKMVGVDGKVVFLSCSRRELYRRTKNAGDRPLLAVTSSTHNTLYKRINMLLERRIGNYRKADMVISTSTRSPRQTAVELKKKIVG